MSNRAKKILSGIGGKLEKAAQSTVKALSLPQEILMKKAAEAVGAKPGETSEESAFNIVDKVSKRVGMGDSTIENAIKGIAVGGLETFADPLGPLGKVGKVSKVKNIIRKAPKHVFGTGKAVETLQKAGRGGRQAEKIPEILGKSSRRATKPAEFEAKQKLISGPGIGSETPRMRAESLDKPIHKTVSGKTYSEKIKLLKKQQADRLKKKLEK